MSTLNLPQDYVSAIKVIDTFVKNIFAGSDETQKKDLHENLLEFSKLYTPSNMTKKRPSKSDTNDTQVEKQAKIYKKQLSECGNLLNKNKYIIF